jgi:LPXTG-motif cell wall-anchored protein
MTKSTNLAIRILGLAGAIAAGCFIFLRKKRK